MKTDGLHHVTAITARPQENIDFYTGTLGLRLVKLTVNFDDPHAYHLYYGDAAGCPGTVLSFFSWPTVRPGLAGTREATSICLSVPEGALHYWEARLTDAHIHFEKRELFGRNRIAFNDPDGIEIELVGSSEIVTIRPWTRSAIPEATAIRGFHGIVISETEIDGTRSILTDRLGYRELGREDTVFLFDTGVPEPGRYVIVRLAPDLPPGLVGAGSIHHVAFRASNDADEADIRTELIAHGVDATPVIDRMYFRSVYFHEPGGVLFEIATDQPGFAVDETLASLGTSLRLPPQHEENRVQIEQWLPHLRLPV